MISTVSAIARDVVSPLLPIYPRSIPRLPLGRLGEKGGINKAELFPQPGVEKRVASAEEIHQETYFPVIRVGPLNTAKGEGDLRLNLARFVDQGQNRLGLRGNLDVSHWGLFTGKSLKEFPQRFQSSGLVHIACNGQDHIRMGRNRFPGKPSDPPS